MPENKRRGLQKENLRDGERRVRLHPVTLAEPGIPTRRSASSQHSPRPVKSTLSREKKVSPAAQTNADKLQGRIAQTNADKLQGRAAQASADKPQGRAPHAKSASPFRTGIPSVRRKKKKPRYLELDEESGTVETRIVTPKGGKPDEEELRERDYRIRVAGQIGRVRHIWQNILTVVIVAAVSAAVLFGLTRMIFSVGEITLSGNECYSSQTIRGCLGFDYGDFLPTVSVEKAEKNILAACPYVTAVRVEKAYPNRVFVTVTEGEPAWRTGIGQGTALLSDTLRVMEIVSFAAASDTIPELILPEINRAVEGEVLTLPSSDALDAVLAVSSCMARIGDAYPVLSLDVTNLRRITMTCAENITIILGDGSDLPMKMEVARKILQDKLLQDADGAILNVSDPHEATLKLK